MACLLIMIAVRWSDSIDIFVSQNVREEKGWEAMPPCLSIIHVLPWRKIFFGIYRFAP